MFLDDFNAFLLNHSGATYKAIDKFLSKEPEEIGPVFFRPYKSTSDFFKRTAYVGTAPIFLSVIALEVSIVAFCTGLQSVYNLLTLNTTQAKESAKELLTSVIFMTGVLIAAVASPFVNLVDLIGGGISSLKQTNNNTEEVYSPEAHLSI